MFSMGWESRLTPVPPPVRAGPDAVRARRRRGPGQGIVDTRVEGLLRDAVPSPGVPSRPLLAERRHRNVTAPGSGLDVPADGGWANAGDPGSVMATGAI